jgi:hypothetical protein
MTIIPSGVLAGVKISSRFTPNQQKPPRGGNLTSTTGTVSRRTIRGEAEIAAMAETQHPQPTSGLFFPGFVAS